MERWETALTPANDAGAVIGATSFPADAVAIIHCPAPSAMSAGRAQAGDWVLEFAARAASFVEPLMGWTGGADTLNQVRLRFPSRATAVAYARRQGLAYEVREPAHMVWNQNLPVMAANAAHRNAMEPAMSWAMNAPHSAARAKISDASTGQDNARSAQCSPSPKQADGVRSYLAERHHRAGNTALCAMAG